MQKNVASQTWLVFAFDRTTQVPKTGDAANITAVLRIDGAASAATNDVNPTEISDGYYEFDLTQAETNGSEILIIPSSVTANIQVVGCPALQITTPQSWPSDVVQTGDSFARIGAAGVGLTNIGDSRVANLDTTVSSRLAPAGTLANVTTVNGLANGTITASSIASDAITASKVAADAVAEIQSGLALEATAQSILTDTNELQTNQGNWLTATGFSTPTNVTDARDAVQADIAAIGDVYQAQIEFTDDEGNAQDEYTVTWFKNGAPITSGITSPTIQVIKRVDGTDLVASTAMTEIGSTHTWKYDETTNRISSGEAVVVHVEGTIDGSTRTARQVVSRDSTA